MRRPLLHSNCQLVPIPGAGALFLVLATVCAAQPESCCRIIRGEFRGTGVYVARNDKVAFVLTAAHVGRGAGGPWLVRFPASGQTLQAIQANPDHRQDLAILVIKHPKGVEPSPLRAAPLGTGETYTTCGYGSGQYAQSIGGLRRGRYGDGRRVRWVRIGGPARSGDSGGPVFDSRGRVAAVLWGTDGAAAMATPASVIVKRLQGYCSPGGCYPPVQPRSPITYRQPDVPKVPSDAEQQLSRHEQQLAKIENQQEKNQKTLEEISSQLAGLEPCKCEPTEPVDTGTIAATVAEALQDEFAEIERRLSELEKRPLPEPPQDEPDAGSDAPPFSPPVVDGGDAIPDRPSGPNEESPWERVIYFTSSEGCPNCQPLDERIRYFKDSGRPITVVDLEPNETSIRGVPRLFYPDSGRTIRGLANCRTHVAGWLPP